MGMKLQCPRREEGERSRRIYSQSIAETARKWPVFGPGLDRDEN
jgi:hypothetical protein